MIAAGRFSNDQDGAANRQVDALTLCIVTPLQTIHETSCDGDNV